MFNEPKQTRELKSDIDWISVAVPGYERFQVFLNGKPVNLKCLEAKAGFRGYVVEGLYGLDAKLQRYPDGRPKYRVLYGLVEIRAIPRKDLNGIIGRRL